MTPLRLPAHSALPLVGSHKEIDRAARAARVAPDVEDHSVSHPAAVEPSTSAENAPRAHAGPTSSIYAGFPTLATSQANFQTLRRPFFFLALRFCLLTRFAVARNPPAVEASAPRKDVPPAHTRFTPSIYIGFPTLAVIPSESPRTWQAPFDQRAGGLLPSNPYQYHQRQDERGEGNWHSSAIHNFPPSSATDVGIPLSTPTRSLVIPSSSAAFPPLDPSHSGSSERKFASPSTRELEDDPPRSEWAMWVGNVPGDATYDELWRFFSNQSGPSSRSGRKRARKGVAPLPPTTNAPQQAPSTTGVLSIYMIPLSHCAFINYDSPRHLSAALARFEGVSLRPHQRKCRPFICRRRRLEDGVRGGAIRCLLGTGLHAHWIKQKLDREGASEGNFYGKQGEVVVTDEVLRKFFPQRYFLLKSRTSTNLDLSAVTGLWATQKHNEDVLNQAFRTSKDIYLIFSVNKSGGFYGYARMAGPIAQDTQAHVPVAWARRDSTSSSSTSPLRLYHSPDPIFAASAETTHRRRSSDVPSAARAVDQTARLLSRLNIAESEPSSSHPGSTIPPDEAALARTRRSAASPGPASAVIDDAQSPNHGAPPPNSDWGTEFAVTWIRTEGLSFTHTRGLSNPWNYNRPVQISRDGTELEPGVGKALMDLWCRDGEAVP